MQVESKKEIRKRILNIRNNMSEDLVDNLSEKTMSTLVKLPVFKRSNTVMLYLSFNNEVDSFRLIDYCFKEGKKVVVPYCIKEGTRIVPTEVRDIYRELRKSSFGYMEPKKEFLRPISTEEIDLIVIPGIAFDKRCYRIGFGAGYYDRFLGKLNFSIPTIGLAYDFQILEKAPIQMFDVPLDFVITERRIIVRP
ncbi:5-formyltetrahydrofolate cyclo-ligase [Gottschalkia purinilytica]|uniref:5-formyltetrahydrofolate cyclo-ligase n=1 Tax=Gottschalkia purinilytica TaxID=1503 RepID=A0A0L0WE94_GOTPU|nr:5-formyltetrahydrofolate cyclo-ligase [Gottschalkia purinilytica]KNF09802.1 5-formyltetrahydrofolate cyclo-ligase [Gottschalkia purinilytica]